MLIDNNSDIIIETINKYIKKCDRNECNYSIHTNIYNNIGTHCCLLCKQNSRHRPRCNKIEVT
jgi:hypothetical protein